MASSEGLGSWEGGGSVREASYTDSAGRLWMVLLPDGAPDADAPLGLPLGPPSLAALGLPEELEVRLHNALAARRLFTAQDARRRQNELVGAWQAALRVDARKLLDCFILGGSNPNGTAPRRRMQEAKR